MRAQSTSQRQQRVHPGQHRIDPGNIAIMGLTEWGLPITSPSPAPADASSKRRHRRSDVRRNVRTVARSSSSRRRSPSHRLHRHRRRAGALDRRRGRSIQRRTGRALPTRRPGSRRRQQAEATDDRALCPKCMHVLPHGAVICMKCGYDSRNGAVVSPDVQEAEAAEDASGGPSLVRGLAVCIAAAFVAAAVWLAVSRFTSSNQSYLSILVGIAAGAGMRFGLRRDSLPAGLIAAGVRAARLGDRVHHRHLDGCHPRREPRRARRV